MQSSYAFLVSVLLHFSGLSLGLNLRLSPHLHMLRLSSQIHMAPPGVYLENGKELAPI